MKLKPMARKRNAIKINWKPILEYARKPLSEFLILAALSTQTVYNYTLPNQPQQYIPQEQKPLPIIPTKVESLETVVADSSFTADVSIFSLDEKSVKKALKRLVRYNPFIQQASEHFGVDKEELEALACVESGGRSYALSKKGARGLLQLMPETAMMYGLAKWELEKPELNLRTGSAHYKKMLRKYKDPVLAFTAYNWGDGKLDMLIERFRYNKTPLVWENIRKVIPQETRMFVPKVLGLSERFNPKGYSQRFSYK